VISLSPGGIPDYGDKLYWKFSSTNGHTYKLNFYYHNYNEKETSKKTKKTEKNEKH